MKKISIIFVILLVLFLAFFYYKKIADAPDYSINPDNKKEELKKELDYSVLIKSSQIKIPNNNSFIKLENGFAKFENEGTKGVVNFISILGVFDDPNKKDVKNIFADFIIDSGGSGNFRYILSFNYENENLKYNNYFYVGDRVPILGLEKLENYNNGYFISLNYLDRDREDSFSSEPNLKVNKILRIKDGNILPSKKEIFVENIIENQKINNPVSIKGMARGSWFFEASFPVFVVDWDGRIIGQGIAQAGSDWMTQDYVPFTVEIKYDNPQVYNYGVIILKKDNPSGLPENDDYLEIQVNF